MGDVTLGQLAPPLRVLLDRPEAERAFGPFQLVRQLGRGAFAPVWLAREVYGDREIRRVAIKLFAPGSEPVPERISFSGARALDEARLLERLDHPHIVRFLFTINDKERGLVGIVMEYVEGPSLDRRIARGPLSVEDTLDLGARVASALSAVHRAGLVHRDVKPANIIAGEGVTKLIDFGIATAHRDEAGRAPRRVELLDLPAETLGENLATLAGLSTGSGGGSLVISSTQDLLGLPSGTVGYIDPACIGEGLSATPASDIYSLGATLFECLAGRVPSVIAAGKGGGMKGEVLDGRAPPPRLAAVAQAVPAEVARLIDAMLEPARERRPASAEEVAVTLERARRARVGRACCLPAEDQGPFRAGAFGKDDRDVFFGRSSEVATALEMLRSRGLCAIAGAAGCGQTSLLRAAIAPTVEDSGLGDWIERWDVRLVEPGEDARAAVVAALQDLVPESALREPDALALALAARAQAERRGLLLVIDRLEALPDSRGSAWVAELLARIADPPSFGVRAVVAARRDRLDALLSLGPLARALPQGLMMLPDLSEAAWRDVLQEAARSYTYRFEDDALLEQLAAALARRERRAAAQRALQELWAARDRKEHVIRRGQVDLRLEPPAPQPAPPPGFGPPQPPQPQLEAFGAPPPLAASGAAPTLEPQSLQGPAEIPGELPARMGPPEQHLVPQATAPKRGARLGAALGALSLAAIVLLYFIISTRGGAVSDAPLPTATGRGAMQATAEPRPSPTPSAPINVPAGGEDDAQLETPEAERAAQMAELATELDALRRRVLRARTAEDLRRIQQELQAVGRVQPPDPEAAASSAPQASPTPPATARPANARPGATASPKQAVPNNRNNVLY